MRFNIPPSMEFIPDLIEKYKNQQKEVEEYGKEWVILQDVINDLEEIKEKIIPERFRDENKS